MSLNLYEINERCADEQQCFRCCGGEDYGLEGESVVVVKASVWDQLITSQPVVSHGQRIAAGELIVILP